MLESPRNGGCQGVLLENVETGIGRVHDLAERLASLIQRPDPDHSRTLKLLSAAAAAVQADTGGRRPDMYRPDTVFIMIYFNVRGVSLPAKITSENDLRKSSDWFLKHTSNQNFLGGHFQRCFRRLFSPEEIPLYCIKKP